MISSSSGEEWIAIARERAADADAMVASRPASMGPVYLAGYAVECSLNAYLQIKGIQRPDSKQGRHRHDLLLLWRTAGFRMSDLSDTSGAKAFFLNDWSAGLRYRLALPSHINTRDLVDGAINLAGWIQKQARRIQGRKR